MKRVAISIVVLILTFVVGLNSIGVGAYPGEAQRLEEVEFTLSIGGTQLTEGTTKKNIVANDLHIQMKIAGADYKEANTGYYLLMVGNKYLAYADGTLVIAKAPLMAGTSNKTIAPRDVLTMDGEMRLINDVKSTMHIKGSEKADVMHYYKDYVNKVKVVPFKSSADNTSVGFTVYVGRRPSVNGKEAERRSDDIYGQGYTYGYRPSTYADIEEYMDDVEDRLRQSGMEKLAGCFDPTNSNAGSKELKNYVNKCLEHVSNSDLNVVEWVNKQYFNIPNPFTKGRGTYDIAINYTRSGLDAYNYTLVKYWTVYIKDNDTQVDITPELDNNSYISCGNKDNKIAEGSKFTVYVDGTGIAPYTYAIMYTTKGNVSGNKVKDETKLTNLATNEKVDDKLPVSKKFDAPKKKGDYCLVVRLKDENNDYVTKCINFSVVSEEELKESSGGSTGGGTDDDSTGDGEDETSDVQEFSSLEADRELTFEQQQRIEEINKQRDYAEETKLWSWVYTLATLAGIVLLIYSLLLLVAYYIDVFNSFANFSILQRLTFGKMYPVGAKSNLEYVMDSNGKDGVVYVTNSKIWITFCLGVILSAVLMNVQSLVLLFLQLSKWFDSILH